MLHIQVTGELTQTRGKGHHANTLTWLLRLNRYMKDKDGKSYPNCYGRHECCGIVLALLSCRYQEAFKSEVACCHLMMGLKFPKLPSLWVERLWRVRKILTESKLAEENSINVQEDVDRLELKWAENGFGLNKIEDCVLAVQLLLS